MGLILVLLLAGGDCSAQYRATIMTKLDSVAKAGIFRIVLPPSFVAGCRADFSDLRIFDEKDKEAPYVLRESSPDRLTTGFLPIPDPNILQKDSSDQHSYFWLQYDNNYRIDRLSLVITGPALYKRTAVVSTVPGNAMPVATISIDPADSVFRLPPLRANRLLIEVANHDNAPLVMTRVATSQLGIYLLTYLQPGHEYWLMAGDPKVNTPDYDLHYFTDSMPVTTLAIGLGPLRRFLDREGRAGQPSEKGISRKPGVLFWSLVVLILLLLLYVSVKLARAVDQKDFGKKSKEKNDRL